MHWFTGLIESHPPEAPSIEFDVKRDIETILFNGGTTGLPKGCMLTHFNVVSNCVQTNALSGGTSQTGHVVRGNIAVLIGTPFFHSYGHATMHSMTRGGMMQLLVPDPRDTRTMVEMIKEHRPLLQFGVPTQFMKMLDEELKDITIVGLSGSAALPPETQAQFEEKGAGALM